MSTTFDDVSGTLSVTSDAADSIVIGSNLVGHVTINGNGFVSPTGESLFASQVRAITVKGGPGNNIIDLSAVEPLAYEAVVFRPHRGEVKGRIATIEPGKLELPNITITIDGGAGSDTITGSEFSDLIDCLSGADVVNGNFGDDIFYVRNDDISSITLEGSDGNDFLFLDYTRTVGAKMSVSIDVGTETGMVAYAGKTCTFKGIPSSEVRNLIDEMEMTLSDSTGVAGNSRVEVKRVMGSATEIVQVTDSQNKTKAKWQNIVLKRGFVSDEPGWNWRIDPSPGPTSITCTAPGNTISVNTYGRAADMTPGAVTVQGMAAVSINGATTVKTHTEIYDGAAMADLKSQGVSITTNMVDEIDGSFTAHVTITNNGTSPVIDPVLTWSSNSDESWRWTQLGGPFRTNSMASNLLRVKTGVQPESVVLDTGRRRDLDVFTDQSSEDVLTVQLADIVPGQSISTSLTFRKVVGATKWPNIVLKQGFADRVYDMDVSNFFETGEKPTQVQFAAVIDSTTGKTPGNGATTLIGLDASGLLALVSSTATGIDPGITVMTAGAHLYVGGRMVGVAPDGATSGNASTGKAEMSRDGRWVIFESSATNLVTGLIDTNGGTDIFLRDMVRGKTICLSAISPTFTTTGNGASFDPAMTSDGMTVIFRSSATNLIPTVVDNNNEPDLFLASVSGLKTDTELIDYSCASLIPGVNQTCDKGVIVADINGDGAVGDITMAWLTDATNTGGPTGAKGHVVAKKMLGQPKIGEASALFSPTGPNGVSVSPDGKSVVVWSAADLSSLIGVPDTNGVSDIVRITVDTGAVQCLTLNATKTGTANGASPAGADAPAVSYDASHVAFSSTATNLTTTPTPPTDGVFLVLPDVEDACYRLDTVGASNFGSNNRAPSLSANGQHITWLSPTNYAATGSGNGKIQAWVKDCYDGKDYRRAATMISVSETGAAGDADTKRVIHAHQEPRFGFSSNASNIVTGDTNGQSDVFVSSRHDSCYIFELTAGQPAAVTIAYDEPTSSIVVKDAVGMPLVSQPVSSFGPIHVYLRDGVDDAVTVDLNLQRLGGSILIHGDGNSADRVIAVALPGTTAVMNINFDGHNVNAIVPRDILKSFFANGSQRTVSSTWVTIQCENIDIFEDLTAATHTSVRMSGNVEVKVESSKFKLAASSGASGFFANPVVDRSSNLVMSPSNDTVTVNLNGLPPGQPIRFSIFGNGGDDSVTDQTTSLQTTRGFLTRIAGIPDSQNASVLGSAGDDTIAIDSGNGTMNGGLGNDVYLVSMKYTLFLPDGTPCRAIDTGGNDNWDFSGVGAPVTFNMDSTAPQTFTGNRLLQVTGVIENATGTPHDDSFVIKGLSVPRSVDGGSQVSPAGDTLSVDAEGKAASIFGGQVHIQGKAPITFSNFESVVVTNNAPTLQVANVQIDDGSAQRSRIRSLTVAFSGTVDFGGMPPEQAFTLTRPGASIELAASVAVNNGFTVVTLTFPGQGAINGALSDGRYTLTALASKISGGMLDGNGDGGTGDNYMLASDSAPNPPTNIYTIFGDITGDGNVAANDFIQFRQFFNGVNTYFDYDNDGAVAASDFIQFRLRFNGSI